MLVVILVGFLVAVLLNATDLEDGAKEMPYGNERDFWTAVWKPFGVVSRGLFLDAPRDAIDEALNRPDDARVFELPGATPGPSRTATAAPPATPTPEPPPRVRTPDVTAPLRVWIGGDSLTKVLGEAFVRQATESGIIAATQDSQLSSGLTRPDFFDWPGHFASLATNGNHEVYVVMFGANDSQGIKTPEGDIYQPGDEGWTAEYRRRVAGTMDLLKGDNRKVYWVGQPVMRSAEFSQRMAELNAVYREEAARRPWVEFIDLWPRFTTAAGEYDAYLTDDDGEVKLMRHPDGVHLVRDGGERAARTIMAAIREDAGLP